MRRSFLPGLLTILVLCWAPRPGLAQGATNVETGIRAYTERGDAREAIRLIGDALDAGAVGASARPRAHVYMAHAFLTLADTASALPHIQRALAAEPCLLPSTVETPPAWISLYDRARPAGVSCDRKLGSATLMSLVPGLAQRSLGRTGPGLVFLGGTAAAAGGSFLLLQHADRRFSEYERSTDYGELGRLFDEAQQARNRGLLLGGVAAAIYLANVVDAVISASAHDRAISAVRPLSLVPLVTSDGSGFALRIPAP